MTRGREGSEGKGHQKGTRKRGREGQRREGTGRRGSELLYFWLKSQYLQYPNINLELKVTADIFSEI